MRQVPSLACGTSKTVYPAWGDYPLFDDTVYSIELNVVRSVPEWDGQDVRIILEEDAVLTGGAMFWLDGRQDSFHLIGLA